FGANGVALWEGNLYAANTGKGILVSIPILADGSAGEPDLVAGAGDCDAQVKELYGMDGIALDAEGNVYALLVLQNKLVKIDPTDGSFTTLLTKENGLHNPASITFGIGEDSQSILFTNYAVLPPEPAASPGPAVLKFDVGVPGLPLPNVTATISPTPDIKTERIAVPYEDRVIRGTLVGEGDIAVVLAPMFGVPRGHWLPFARHIASLGYTALAFDFPGFGTSSGDFNFDQTTFDVLALIDFLQQERGYERIVCMGASIGASACYEAALLDPSLVGLVIISSSVEITAEEAATLVMPKLLVSGNEPEVIPGMQDSIELLPIPKQYKKILSVSAHGTDIFNTDSSDELRDLLVGFLEELG
ncbi:MAG: alpha/beta fold hydrolase, partial [Chloroflexi bacterium]|nr:alpha/beta fold hydrolase [Chloroflexota bacterium]